MTKPLSIAQAARRARVSRNTVYGLVRRGVLTPDFRGRLSAQEIDALFPPLEGLDDEKRNVPIDWRQP